MDFREGENSVEILPCQSQYVVPICDQSLKPNVGQKFATLEEGMSFYQNYGRACGFDIRRGKIKRSADNSCIMWRYIYCNKEGDKHSVLEDSGNENNIRRRVSKRRGCMARMVLRFNAECGYEVKYFVEQHNHSLVSEQFKSFMKMNMNTDYVHKKFVMDCARAAIGPVKSFRLFKEFVGWYDSIGCTSNDFKTVSREMKEFVEGVDAQMTLDKLKKKKELCSAYMFDYEVDADDKLTRLFWCDPISRRNYHLFGDVVSFDATYSTNRYCMIFAPFTGKNNHGKSITFAAGLLSKEDAESYSWLFEKFKKCMGHSPNLIVTDQDLGMRVALEIFLHGTRHRFCMWHITLKLADKVPYHSKKDDAFKKKLCDIVWSETIDPHDFEIGWGEIMNEFGLSGDKWFLDMYKLREFWIPSYFKEFPFSGLMKAASISESENSRFSRFTRARDNLVEFFMHYDSAIDAQRHAIGELTYLDESCINKADNGLLFEQHVATLYIKSIFDKVKKQIREACSTCSILNIRREDGVVQYEVDDGTDIVHNVTYKLEDNEVNCNCNMFIRLGILCSHVFLLFKNMHFKIIPDKYIVRRWMKQEYFNHATEVDDDAIGKFIAIDDSNKKSNRVISEFYNCLGLVEGSSERMDEFLNDIMCLKVKYKSNNSSALCGLENSSIMERFYGSTLPKKLDVHPPNIVKTKGSGSRLKSRREKEIRERNKPLRLCNKCHQRTNHDARNCGKKKPIVRDAAGCSS